MFLFIVSLCLYHCFVFRIPGKLKYMVKILTDDIYMFVVPFIASNSLFRIEFANGNF